MKRLSIFSALAFTLAATAGSVNSATVDVTINSFAQGSVKTSTTLNATNVSAGMFDITIDVLSNAPASLSWLSSGDMIKAFCVELTETISLPNDDVDGYEIVSLSDKFNNTTQETNIANLFGNSIGGVLGGGEAESGGFQLALWELIYESAPSPFNIGTGNYTSTPTGANGSNAATFANNALMNLGTPSASFDLFVLTLNGTQDLIIWNESTDTNVVSAPAMIAMTLVGMGFIAFRRRFS